MRYGIFGGTFDPPHIGHLILAAEACSQMSLDRILWVLTPYPPHKARQKITPLEHRLEMLQAAIGNDPLFEVCRVDIDRPAPHYAVDTVNILHQLFPKAVLIYLMGGDSLADLPTWHTPESFLAAVDGLGVMLRPGRQVDLEALEKILPGVAEKAQILHAPLIEISSSQLRQRINQGLPYRYFFSEMVYDLIREKGLYLD
ncbi:MAG: nicotinate (nicotinamide) nucleotide adenylyltransferase [Anaerolineales bacterium]|nr:nicotinate (nicotinamide) nucleotide adenylyltransferase [Anaerolineales bacterium]